MLNLEFCFFNIKIILLKSRIFNSSINIAVSSVVMIFFHNFIKYCFDMRVLFYIIN